VPSQIPKPLYAMLPKMPHKNEHQKNTKLFNDENKPFPTQNLFFFQHLFCQRLSAHLQKANAKPTTYFAKELIFPSL